MKTICIHIIILLFHSFYPYAPGQNDPSELIYRVHGLYIYNFIKEVQWPKEYNSGNFIIGVFGNASIETELRKIATTRTANSRKVTVKSYKTIAEIEKNCHILYLAAEASEDLSRVLEKIKGTSTLLITHKDGAAKFGSLINFVSEKGKPRFEMNPSAFEKNRLKYTQQLKTVAIIVN